MFALLPLHLLAQVDSVASVGAQAPSFTLALSDNSVKSFSFPWQSRLVLLHFWQNNPGQHEPSHTALRSIAERYKKVYYKTAEGLELITVNVDTATKAWKDAIRHDSLTAFINGIARQGAAAAVCKKYGVTDFPCNVLIDEKGTVVALNPNMKTLETLLNERKIFQPVKRTLTGLLAQALNRDETFKNGKVFLFTAYGDSLAGGTTLGNGKFTFPEINPKQDLVLRIPGQKDMDPQAPIALYSAAGDYLMNGLRDNTDCVFYIPYKTVPRLLDPNAALGPSEQLLLMHNLEFAMADGFQLSPQDEKYLDAIVAILQKIKSLGVEFKVHTDSKQNAATAMDLCTRQAQLIKNYLMKKGVVASRIKATPKGSSQPLKACADPAACSEEELRQNRRVEFLIF